jgi:hypothetical protein
LLLLLLLLLRPLPPTPADGVAPALAGTVTSSMAPISARSGARRGECGRGTRAVHRQSDVLAAASVRHSVAAEAPVAEALPPVAADEAAETQLQGVAIALLGLLKPARQQQRP